MAAERLLEVYRFNEQGGTYDDFTIIMYTFKGECVIKGLRSFSFAQRKELFRHLRSLDIKFIHYQHKGKKRAVCI